MPSDRVKTIRKGIRIADDWYLAWERQADGSVKPECHIVPCRDGMVHEFDDCACGPSISVDTDTIVVLSARKGIAGAHGPSILTVRHHALDGRPPPPHEQEEHRG